MRAPVKEERALLLGRGEGFRGEAFVIFRGWGCLPRDDTARKQNRIITCEVELGCVDQTVLASSTRTRHKNKMPCHQSTRFPCRQSCFTTGKPAAIETRARSARRPTAISPRSIRPAICAGFFDIVATA